MELSIGLANTMIAVGALALVNVIGVITIFTVLKNGDSPDRADEPAERP